MGSQAEFEKQRLLAERLADEYGVDVLREIVSRWNDPEAVAGLYCLVFQQVFETGMRRRQRRIRGENPLPWLLGIVDHLAQTENPPRMSVEEDLVALCAAEPAAIEAVPPSLIVRNAQFIRATAARAQANLHHRGPVWLKLAITLTVVLAVAAVVWGGFSYMKVYANATPVSVIAKQSGPSSEVMVRNE